MGDSFMAQCPSVGTIDGPEVRFSTKEPVRAIPISKWQLSGIACGEITPRQRRIQWGVPTYDARYDRYLGLRFGNTKNNLTLGARTTYVSSESRLAPVQRQRVGAVSITLDGKFEFRYWNNHKFWWWPMGDGDDQGDTAGLLFRYNLHDSGLSLGSWILQDFQIILRLANGIPNPHSSKPMGKGKVYTEVQFPEVDRGDVGVSTRMTNKQSYSLDVGITVNSGRVRNLLQSELIHRNLGYPEYPATNNIEVMMYLRLTNW